MKKGLQELTMEASGCSFFPSERRQLTALEEKYPQTPHLVSTDRI